MTLEYYPKMMRGLLKAKEKLEDHEPLPPPLAKHIEAVKKMWRILEGMGKEDQARCISACVYETLHWIPFRERDGFLAYLIQGVETAAVGVLQEEKAKGPVLYVPPGSKLS